MIAVIKLRVESFDKFHGESLNRRIRRARICVTYRAHDLIFIDKLIQVAAYAGFVTA
jgi:hypothetical protein